jgi:hypothetical protein
LKLIWTRSRRAFRQAVRVSGISTSRAITTPTAEAGAPIDLTADSIACELVFARPTVATRATRSRAKLRIASARLGGGPCSATGSGSSTPPGSPSASASPAGRNIPRCRTVCTTRKRP